METKAERKARERQERLDAAQAHEVWAEQTAAQLAAVVDAYMAAPDCSID